MLDTTDATTDSDDAQLNADCGAPATDASVWYVLEGADVGVAVDVSQSDYSAGVLVGVGTQGNLEIVTCGSGAVAFFAAAGTTYYVLAFDDQEDGRGNGGSLNISFSDIPPPPTIDIALNRFGRVDSHTGSQRWPGHTRAPTATSSMCSWTQARRSAGVPSLVPGVSRSPTRATVNPMPGPST